MHAVKPSIRFYDFTDELVSIFVKKKLIILFRSVASKREVFCRLIFTRFEILINFRMTAGFTVLGTRGGVRN